MLTAQFGPAIVYHEGDLIVALHCPTGDWVLDEHELPGFTLCDEYMMESVLFDFLVTAQGQKVPWCCTLEDFLERLGYI